MAVSEDAILYHALLMQGVISQYNLSGGSTSDGQPGCFFVLVSPWNKGGRKTLITIIIGQSGSGKTTFAKKLLGEPVELKKGHIYYTKCENGCGLGKYGIGIRTEGTDTLSYSAKQDIKQQIKELKNENLVLEGDRITNKEIFNYILSLRIPVKLYLVNCKIATSMDRLKKAGSTIRPSFVKGTKTKSRRMFLDYWKRMNGEVINTDGNSNL